MLLSIAIIALVGFCISLYAFIVEKKIAADHTYKPVCDLSDRISCSKPIISKYGKFYGISNAVSGMTFYTIMIVAALCGWHTFIMYSALASCMVSVVLAYILYVKIRSICLICTSTYLVNICLLLCAYLKN